MDYLVRFFGTACAAYLGVSTCYWLYACVVTKQLLLDVTLRQFLTEWWRLIG